MIFTQNTLNVLENFQRINNSMVFTPGNVVRVISPTKSILAKAKIDEVFDREFAIYDMSKFLGVLSLFDQPNLVYNENSVDIISDKQRISYVYCDASTVNAPPTKDVSFPTVDYSFNITSQSLAKVQKAANVLGVPDISVESRDGLVTLSAVDVKNPTGDIYSEEIGESNTDFKAVFLSSNMKFLPLDFTLDISAKGISKFVSDKVTYWIALEKKSSQFGE